MTRVLAWLVVLAAWGGLVAIGWIGSHSALWR